MKKLLMTLLILGLTSSNVFAYDYIKEAQSVYFNPANSSWSLTKQSDSDLQLKNKSYIGSGGFQEYYFDNGELAIGPETNVSFVEKGELFGINIQDLKFYRYKYQDGKFIKKELGKESVKKLFPDYKIVKISKFRNNEITLYKKPFHKKKVLLLNDTDSSFYKYNYEPKSVCKDSMKPFIKISHSGKIVFSHYGDDTVEAPALKIYVKNKLK